VRSSIGYCGHSDYCAVAHADRNNTNDYALLQSSSGVTNLKCNSSQYITFRSGNVDRMRMLANGNFGIATANPVYKLRVNGNSRFEDRMDWSVGSRTYYAGYSTIKDWYIRSGETAGTVVIRNGGGKVGIGNASPVYDLHVSSDLFGRHS
jgi:hypothetical protein